MRDPSFSLSYSLLVLETTVIAIFTFFGEKIIYITIIRVIALKNDNVFLAII